MCPWGWWANAEGVYLTRASRRVCGFVEWQLASHDRAAEASYGRGKRVCNIVKPSTAARCRGAMWQCVWCKWRSHLFHCANAKGHGRAQRRAGQPSLTLASMLKALATLARRQSKMACSLRRRRAPTHRPAARQKTLTAITTVSSPWNLGIYLSPLVTSELLRGLNRHITLMVHSAGSAIFHGLRMEIHRPNKKNKVYPGSQERPCGGKKGGRAPGFRSQIPERVTIGLMLRQNNLCFPPSHFPLLLRGHDTGGSAAGHLTPPAAVDVVHDDVTLTALPVLL